MVRKYAIPDWFCSFSGRPVSPGPRSSRSRGIRRVTLGSVRPLFQTLVQVARNFVPLMVSAMRLRAQLAAENLVFRKQLALYLERQVTPRRADDATRVARVAFSAFVDSRAPAGTASARAPRQKPPSLCGWR